MFYPNRLRLSPRAPRLPALLAVFITALFTGSVAGNASPAANAPATDPVVAEVLAGNWRKPTDVARDPARHPAESLAFWGLRPGMAILEAGPGAGWWTDILAPWAARTDSTYMITGADLADPATPERFRQMRAAAAARFAAAPEIYGQVDILGWGPRAAPLPAERFDFVLVARVLHRWMADGNMTDSYLARLHDTLKPGGILAIEQHRAAPGEQDPGAPTGYVTEDWVIATVERAGFRLDGRAEINSNPLDTHDHPFGVWTLPPTRQSAPAGFDPAPTFDRAHYDAIGESDRMTLRFVRAD